MLQSLIALPLSAGAEVLLFLLLCRLSQPKGKQAAVVVAVTFMTALLTYSLLNWPGAKSMPVLLLRRKSGRPENHLRCEKLTMCSCKFTAACLS
jgi:hypothetical protein